MPKLKGSTYLKNTLVHSYIEDIAKRIHDPSLYGAASVMVGAGFSKNADILDDEASAPNWEELAVSMFEALYKKPTEEDDLDNWKIQKIRKTSGKNVLNLAEEYKSVFGRQKLNKFIEASINDDIYIPGNLHKKLLSLNWNDVFTTNYDTLLERTIDKINVKFNYQILTNQTDLPGSTHPRIIKLHGSVDNEKHYIICEEDYRTYPFKFAPLVNTVQQAMLETQLCLIGFSGDDPNFLSWLGWLRDNMGENSPFIYLVGLFENMSEAESMTLKSQNITVVDLGDLFDKKASYQEALDVFLDKLTDYGEKERKLFEPVPYSDKLYLPNFHENIDEKYFKILDAFLSRIKDKTIGHLAFSNNTTTERFTSSIKSHFQELLRLKPSNQQIKLLSKMVFFLRRGSIIMEDPQAEKIESLIDSFTQEELKKEKSLLSSWLDMALYLLEMYRIDGRYEDYRVLTDKLDKLGIAFEGYISEELQIEKCKFFIAIFDYNQAIIEIERINHSIALDIQIRKVFLYKQIDENEKAIDLLRNASAILAQKKLSENKMASITGYLNLCARSLTTLSSGIINQNFSDKEYYGNVYNVRNIYNEMKNDVSNSLLLVHNELRGEKPGFNLGTYRVTYGTSTRKEQDAVSKPLKYIFFQDFLCIPNTFTDHQEILVLGLKKIAQTSQNPVWKWSAIIRTNNTKIIDSFFSRELISSTDIISVKIIFNQLSKLAYLFTPKDQFRNQSRIITQETIFDILTRFSIVMDDEQVMPLINQLIDLARDADEIDLRRINKFLYRLEHSLNLNILNHYFYTLLESNSLPLSFSLVFLDIRGETEVFNINHSVYNKVIAEISSEDSTTRDQGIVKSLLIKEYSSFGEYESQIGKVLWQKADANGFPESIDFVVWIWEELPHPSNINFEKLYGEYLSNPKFVRTVSENGISRGAPIDTNINQYIYLFRMVSNFSENKDYTMESFWTLEYFVNTINYIYDYIDNEKEVLKDNIDFWGNRKEVEIRLVKLGTFGSMLIAKAYQLDLFIGQLEDSFKHLNDLFAENELSTRAFDVVRKAINDSLTDKDIKHLLNEVLIGSRDELRELMSIIDILLMLETNSLTNAKISNQLVKFISSLKYLETQRRSMIINQLLYVIKHPILTNEKDMERIIEAFEEILSRLDSSFISPDRSVIDATYSLSNLVRFYYDNLIENNLRIPEKLTLVIEELKKNNLKEIRYMWEDVK